MPPPSLIDLYKALLKQYGHTGWWPADSPFEVMVGAILTQNTSWSNVKKALANLKKDFVLTPEAIIALPLATLESYLKPSGFFRVKAKRLLVLCNWLIEQGGIDKIQKTTTKVLRQQLLALHGVGHETADDILLYAFNKPVFVIDAYTRRLLMRLKLIHGKEDYETLRIMMEKNLPKNVALYKEFHALIVIHGKQRCDKKRVECNICNLVF